MAIISTVPSDAFEPQSGTSDITAQIASGIAQAVAQALQSLPAQLGVLASEARNPAGVTGAEVRNSANDHKS